MPLFRILNQLQTITNPLNSGTGHKDGALKSVCCLAIDTVGNRREEAVLRSYRLAPCIQHHKTAGSVSTFDHTFREASLTDQCGLLISRNAPYLNRSAEPSA